MNTHRFQEGGTCAVCSQLWPCQPALEQARRLSARLDSVAERRKGQSIEDRLVELDEDLAKATPDELRAAGQLVHSALLLVRIWVARA